MAAADTFGMSFAIIELAMAAPRSAESVSEAIRTVKMANRLIRRAKARPLGMVYGPTSRYPMGTKRMDFAKMGIFAMIDA